MAFSAQIPRQQFGQSIHLSMCQAHIGPAVCHPRTARHTDLNLAIALMMFGQLCSPLSIPAAAGSDPCCLREPFPFPSASKSHPSGGKNYQESPYKGHQVHPENYHLLENTSHLIHYVLSFAAHLRGRAARCSFIPRNLGADEEGVARRRLNRGLRWTAERRGKNCTKTSRVSSLLVVYL